MIYKVPGSAAPPRFSGVVGTRHCTVKAADPLTGPALALIVVLPAPTASAELGFVEIRGPGGQKASLRTIVPGLSGEPNGSVLYLPLPWGWGI